MINLRDFPNYKACIITQPDGDAGDGPQRTFGMYHIARAALGDYDHTTFRMAAELLISPNGDLIRDPVKWNDPKDIPADQFDPTVIACRLYSRWDLVARMMSRHRKRFWFYPNWNPPNFGSISSLLRASDERSISRIKFWDRAFLWSAKIDCDRARRNLGLDGDWLDMDNACARMAFSEIHLPTEISEQVIQYYVENYPMPNPVLTKEGGKVDWGEWRPEGPPLLAALSFKHRAPKNNALFAELWEPIVTRWYDSRKSNVLLLK